MGGLQGIWFFSLALIFLGTAFAAQPGVFDIEQDTTSSVEPSQWFLAQDHWLSIRSYVQKWQGPSDLHVVDVFGASQSIAKAWTRRMYRAASFDIKINESMDVTTESGWYSLLNLCLRMLLNVNIV